MENNPQKDQDIRNILDRLRDIETRVSLLEKHETSTSKSDFDPSPYIENYQKISSDDQEEGIESQVGEYGMAWIGNIVLFFGIIFLLQLLDNQGYLLVSTLFGFASAAGIYILSKVSGKAYPFLANLFNYNSFLLAYVVTIKMHFFSGEPLIASKPLALALVMIVVILLLFIAHQRKNQFFTFMVMALIVIASVISNTTHFMLTLMVFIAAYSLYMVKKFNWWPLLVLSIFLVYPVFFVWLIRNPLGLKGNVSISEYSYIFVYLFLCALSYSVVSLFRSGEKINETSLNASIILNGVGFSMIITFLILNFFRENYYLPLAIISIISLVFSAVLQIRGDWKLASSLYALYGFIIMSLTVTAVYRFPLSFLLLSIQSFLVVSMSLWFRSRFIVVMNMLLYIALLIAYIIMNQGVNSVNFSFALVAFLTARVLNWKKDRLGIKTDMMRNGYLLIGLVMFLLSLYKAVPGQYIALSWTLAAALFFLLSIVLHNVKYRYLAISTMIITTFYFFIFSLKNIGIGYRVVALMFLALISIGFSVYYSRKTGSRKTGRDNND